MLRSNDSVGRAASISFDLDKHSHSGGDRGSGLDLISHGKGSRELPVRMDPCKSGSRYSTPRSRSNARKAKKRATPGWKYFHSPCTREHSKNTSPRIAMCIVKSGGDATSCLLSFPNVTQTRCYGGSGRSVLPRPYQAIAKCIFLGNFEQTTMQYLSRPVKYAAEPYLLVLQRRDVGRSGRLSDFHRAWATEERLAWGRVTAEYDTSSETIFRMRLSSSISISVSLSQGYTGLAL